MNARELIGNDFWKECKADLDDLLAYRKTIKGKPDQYQQAQITINKQFIDYYNSFLFCEVNASCTCKGCQDRKRKRDQLILRAVMEPYIYA